MSPSIFECCHKCKPPKRNPYCHADCPEYEAACVENEKRKAFEKEARNKGYTEGAIRYKIKLAKKTKKYRALRYD